MPVRREKVTTNILLVHLISCPELPCDLKLLLKRRRKEFPNLVQLAEILERIDADDLRFLLN